MKIKDLLKRCSGGLIGFWVVQIAFFYFKGMPNDTIAWISWISFALLSHILLLGLGYALQLDYEKAKEFFDKLNGYENAK